MDAAGMMKSAVGGLGIDPMTFVKRPQVILRLVGILFAIIVFGCVSSCDGPICIYNGKSSACSFAIGIGVFALLGLVAFTGLEAYFERISNVKTRRHVLLADLAYSGCWAFLWFVTFCILANGWSNTTEHLLTKHKLVDCKNSARAAIAFALFSVAVFGGLTFFNLQRFRLGSETSFDGMQNEPAQPGNMAADATAAPYSGGYGDAPGDGQGYTQAYATQPGMGNEQAYYTPTY